MENKIKINVDMMCFIIFLILKLDGVIDWKWVWVFSPFWSVWMVQICIALFVVLKNIKPKFKPCKPYTPLVWDAKTNTMYGPFGEDA